jgi:hypothetical protein
MPFTFRKRLRFGPLVFNFGRSGFNSWGLKVGPLTWNSRTGSTSVDLPGPVNYRTRSRRRR